MLEPEQMEILQKLSESKGKKVITPSDYQDDTHTDNLKLKIFNSVSERKYSDLVSMIKNTYSIGDNKAKDFLTYFIDKKFIQKSEINKKVVYSL